MTEAQFNARHGQAWDAFKKSPVFIDLLRVADGIGPATQAHKIPLEQMQNNNAALMGSISGFALFRSVLLRLGSTRANPEEEADFATSIEEQFEREHGAPAVKKTTRKK